MASTVKGPNGQPSVGSLPTWPHLPGALPGSPNLVNGSSWPPLGPPDWLTGETIFPLGIPLGSCHSLSGSWLSMILILTPGILLTPALNLGPPCLGLALDPGSSGFWCIQTLAPFPGSSWLHYWLLTPEPQVSLWFELCPWISLWSLIPDPWQSGSGSCPSPMA